MSSPLQQGSLFQALVLKPLLQNQFVQKETTVRVEVQLKPNVLKVLRLMLQIMVTQSTTASLVMKEKYATVKPL